MENSATIGVNPLNIDAMDTVDISSPQNDDNDNDIFESTIQVSFFFTIIQFSLITFLQNFIQFFW